MDFHENLHKAFNALHSGATPWKSHDVTVVVSIVRCVPQLLHQINLVHTVDYYQATNSSVCNLVRVLRGIPKSNFGRAYVAVRTNSHTTDHTEFVFPKKVTTFVENNYVPNTHISIIDEPLGPGHEFRYRRSQPGIPPGFENVRLKLKEALDFPGNLQRSNRTPLIVPAQTQSVRRYQIHTLQLIRFFTYSHR